MCVTNTTGRRHQPIAFNPLQLSLFQKSPLSAAAVESVPVAVPSFPTSVSALDPIPVFSNNHAEKSRPKRRRKPQKPGKTAKNNDRHFVVHHYHDHANDIDNGDDVHHCEGDESSSEECHHRRRGGVAVAFPVKLHEVLDQVEADGYAHIISWQPHGRCFMIHQPKEFVDFIMPRYFRQTKLTSFQRQLNLYGFNRITRGLDSGAYYCELFLRYRVFLCKHMIRTKVKGTRFKAASNPENEPDFYSMPFVTAPPMEASQCETTYVPSTVQTTLPQNSVSLEPIPLVYSMQGPSAQTSSLQQLLSSYSQTDFSSRNQVSLDDSGSEDYLMDSGSEGLEDFSIDWDPAFDETFEMTLKDDIQLGFMLDKLLEE